jgi:hypothetical protein
MSEESEERKGFTVVDRRHGRESAESEAGREPEPRQPAAGAAPPPPPHPAGAPPSTIDFATFLLSLSTSVLYHLGLVPEREGTQPPPPDLPMARQTIEILEMLEGKTRGNLSDEEAHLLESLLYELRMRYVDAQKRPA